ncbi:MAG: glycosyltransferase family 2 protein [Hyphomonadaceae bacterium]
MSAPDVSVIVAAWKAESSLKRAVTSALASTGVTVEVIIIDDASPDGTFALARQLAVADPRVVAERLPENGGPSVARNRAIALAKGRYVAILDADDAMTEERLATMLRHAEASCADIVVDNMIPVDDSGARIGSANFLISDTFADDCRIDLPTWIAFNEPMKQGDCIGYLKPLIRRDSLPANGRAYDPALRNSEDYYLVADLLAAGRKMQFVAEPGYLYTRSSGSTSHRLKPEYTAAWLYAEKRFMAAHDAHLSMRDRKCAKRRERALRNVHQFVTATEAVKARKLGNAFSVIASDLQGAVYTLGVFARIALGKVLRRKLV